MNGTLYGIVTATDVTTQFIEESEPFVLLSELEGHLRNLLRDKILVVDLKNYVVKIRKKYLQLMK